jgi:putative addiction module component (TIGR02574 family)
MTIPYQEIFALPIERKMELVEELWDSVAVDIDKLPAPDWQMEELARRRAKFLAHRNGGRPWKEVERELRERHGGSRPAP